MNGIIYDNEICPGSIQVTPIYMNSDSSSETVIGTLVSFRSSAGWLIMTVRLDCPWLAFFSYNGKLPKGDFDPIAAGNAPGSAPINRRMMRAATARALLQGNGNGNGNSGSSSSGSTGCPSLTSNGTTFEGNGNGQYQNGKPDPRSTMFLEYYGSLSNKRVSEVISMYRYQVRA